MMKLDNSEKQDDSRLSYMCKFCQSKTFVEKYLNRNQQSHRKFKILCKMFEKTGYFNIQECK